MIHTLQALHFKCNEERIGLVGCQLGLVSVTATLTHLLSGYCEVNRMEWYLSTSKSEIENWYPINVNDRHSKPRLGSNFKAWGPCWTYLGIGIHLVF